MTARDKPRTDIRPNPWSVPVVVAQIPETGLHREIEAHKSERDALAATAGLREVAAARATFELVHAGNDSVHVRGRVSARVGQVCVVTLDPIENDVVEDIDLIFVPQTQLQDAAASADNDEDADGEIPDPPEPIINGVIDLGRLATDALFLGLDPYPRKPDAVFDRPLVAGDPEDHPFAALKALKNDSGSPGGKKPERK